MIRTHKYRLYPNRTQDSALDFLLWQGRNLYNSALEQRISVYRETGKGVSYVDQWNHFRDVRRESSDTLGHLNATCVQQMLRRLDKSFAAFFRRLKTGETPGFPRFKGRNRFHSLEFRYGDGVKIRDRKLYIQNVGEVRINLHRYLPEDAVVKHVVLKRSVGKWYVCLQFEVSDVEKPPHLGPEIGIDVGLHSLLAGSNGDLAENPRWMRGSLQKIRVANRRLSRRTKGSHRRRKAAFQVAKLHERVSNQRRDFWHKVTRKLADSYSLIALEDLTLDFMTRNKHLALSAHDASLGMFRQMIDYKAADAGSQIILVDPRNTSQECSGCGELVKKSLSVRVHRCSCGEELDRDVNAARNILSRALKALGRSVQASTWAEVRLSVA